MPTDATGPTTSLGIPTFATSADAPSGLGFNNTMSVIDGLLKNLGIAGLVANDVPVYDSVAGKFKKATGTPSSSTFLRGDGSWASAGVKTTTSAISGGPPGSPADGDIWIATGVDANGTRWAFQYNAGSASAYKWEFIGGAPLQAETQTSPTATSTTYVNLSTSVSLTVPRAGDYDIRHGASYVFASAAGVYVSVAAKLGSAAASDVDSYRTYIVSASLDEYSGMKALPLRTLAASDAVTLQGKSSSGTATIANPWLSILPRRVS